MQLVRIFDDIDAAPPEFPKINDIERLKIYSILLKKFKSIFPLEITSLLCDYAWIYPSDSIRCNDTVSVMKSEKVVVELTLSRKVKGIRVQVCSHDQGWSIYPQNTNTFDNSWTYGLLRCSNEDLGDVRVYTNLHAVGDWHQYDHYLSLKDKWVSQLKVGDVVQFVARADFDGWQNFVKNAQLCLYYDI